MPLLIQVTAEDIRLGIRGRSSDCPVALAFKRVTGSIVKVDYKTVWSMMWKNGPVRPQPWDLPPVATNFVKRFDTGLPVEPFEFEVKST